jgi:hypothetical protein
LSNVKNIVKSDLINDYEINDKNSRRAKREEL